MGGIWVPVGSEILLAFRVGWCGIGPVLPSRKELRQLELAKNLYEVLGVAPSSSALEIRLKLSLRLESRV